MVKSKDIYVSSSQAAILLGFSNDYIRKLILSGKIKAEKIGRNWIIKKKNLDKISRQRKRFTRRKDKIADGSN